MASFYATIAYGAMISKSDLVVHRPDPYYGKFRLNPDTGAPVKEYIEEKIDIDDVCNKFNLKYAETTDQLYIVIGNVSHSVLIGEGGEDEYTTFDPTMTDEQKQSLVELLKYINSSESPEPRLYLIGRCSY